MQREISGTTPNAVIRTVGAISPRGVSLYRLSLPEMYGVPKPFANGLSAEVELPEVEGNKGSRLSPAEVLFSETNSRFVVEVQKGEEDKFEKMMKGFVFSRIGAVTQERFRVSDSSKKKVVDLAAVELATPEYLDPPDFPKRSCPTERFFYLPRPHCF